MASSTLGTFLRSFTWGHVRQLDKTLGVALGRAWSAGAGPGTGPVTIDIDSMICEVSGKAKGGGAYGHAKVLGYWSSPRWPDTSRKSAKRDNTVPGAPL